MFDSTTVLRTPYSTTCERELGLGWWAAKREGRPKKRVRREVRGARCVDVIGLACFTSWESSSLEQWQEKEPQREAGGPEGLDCGPRENLAIGKRGVAVRRRRGGNGALTKEKNQEEE